MILIILFNSQKEANKHISENVTLFFEQYIDLFSVNQSSTVPPSESEKLNTSANTDDAPEGGIN